MPPVRKLILSAFLGEDEGGGRGLHLRASAGWGGTSSIIPNPQLFGVGIPNPTVPRRACLLQLGTWEFATGSRRSRLIPRMFIYRPFYLKDLKDLGPTEGRVVGLCWAKLKPSGPKGGPLSP